MGTEGAAAGLCSSRAPTPPFLPQPRGLEILSFPTKLMSPIKGKQLLGSRLLTILTPVHWPADPDKQLSSVQGPCLPYSNTLSLGRA